MELTQKILNLSVAFAIVMLSLSVFIYSIQDSRAQASPERVGNKTVAGVVTFGGKIKVVLYDPMAEPNNRVTTDH